MKRILAATAAMALFAGSASAATLTGSFGVTAVNVVGISGADSQAEMSDYLTALGNVGDPGVTSDDFTYTGDFAFRTSDGSDGTTIASWLATGGGIVSGLDAAFGALQQSKPDIGAGTATTTFYLFTSLISHLAGEMTVNHDDGVAIYDDGVRIGGTVGPTAEQTILPGDFDSTFDGGTLSFLYVATNGDPSVLEVDGPAAVPLPASLPLLLAGLGGFAALRRRKRA